MKTFHHKSLRRSDIDGARSGPTTGSLLSWGKKLLRVLGPQESQQSAERLLEAATGLKRFEFYIAPNQRVPRKNAGIYQDWVRRRKQREPLAYILKEAGFWNETLSVTPACLIPRPETEVLVEQFIDNSGFEQQDAFAFLDLGCGSGAIAVALLRHYGNARAVLSDVSAAALKVAQKNLKRYDLSSRAKLVCSDLFERINTRKWDAILCNPPYVAHRERRRLLPELGFEPRAALYAPENGYYFYRRIASEAAQNLRSQGWLWLELGRGQARKVRKLIEIDFAPESIRIYNDYSGIERVLAARRRS